MLGMMTLQFLLSSGATLTIETENGDYHGLAVGFMKKSDPEALLTTGGINYAVVQGGGTQTITDAAMYLVRRHVVALFVITP